MICLSDPFIINTYRVFNVRSGLDKEDPMKKYIEVISEQRIVPENFDYSTNQVEHEVLDNAFDAIFVHTLDGKIIEINETACRRLGLKRSELVNKEREELLALALVGSMPEYIELIKRDGKLSFESVSITESGNLIPVEVRSRLIKFKGKDAILTFSRDLIEQRKNENTEQEKLDALKHAINLSRLYSIEKVADYSFDIIEEIIGQVKGAIGIVDEDYIRFVFVRELGPKKLPNLPLNGKGITVRAVTTGETQYVWDTSRNKEYIKYFDGSNLLSELDVPIKVEGTVKAVINIQVEKANAFTEEDIKIIELLAEHISSAMIRIELLKRTNNSEETLRDLLESPKNSMIILKDTKIKYVNKLMATQLGYSDPSKIIGKDVKILITDE
jgi:PAS domain S-box-containing protein